MNINKYYTFEKSITINTKRNELFDFHRNTNNLKIISPQFPLIELVSISDIPLKYDSIVKLKLNFILFTISWTIRISEVEIFERIVDLQTNGPFAFWKHYHIFTSVEEGTLMTDRVDYIPPFGIIGRMVNPLIKFQLNLLFSMRHKKTKFHFEKE